MLGAKNGYIVVGSIVAVLLVVALSLYGGYRYRDAECKEAYANDQLEIANAFAVLARQYAAADSAYREERRKRLLKDSTDRGVGYEAITTTDTHSSGWTDDERRILHQSYCTAFPAAPSCALP